MVEFGTHVDLIACIPLDIIKPGHILRNHSGALEGEMVKMSKNYNFLNLFSILKKNSFVLVLYKNATFRFIFTRF